jgi:hypothetical protein
VRLLLDVHHSPRAALQLREAGHDVIAAADDPALAGLEDDDLLRVATRDDRSVVTENARDFDRIVREWSSRSEHHNGVVLTSPRRYHRGSKAYPANLVRGLTALLGNPPATTRDRVHWLD